MTNVKHFIKICISYIFYISGIFKLILKFKGYPVLTYHNIIQDKYFDNKLHLGVSHSNSVFEKQLNVLSKYVGKENLHLTFDDGYKNNLENAVPILEKFGLVGEFFVPLHKKSTDQPFWIDKIMFFFSYIENGNYSLVAKNFKLTDNNRGDMFSFFFDAINKDYSLKNIITDEVSHYLKTFNVKINQEYWDSRFSFLDKDDYDTMMKNNHKLGFHMVNHDICSHLTMYDIEKELDDVKILLERYNITSFSFPFGGKTEVNLNMINLLKERGFTFIYSNTNLNLHKDIKSRVSIPNIKNKYLIISSYMNFF
ncbi:polysaccharide deacetylase family protein [Flavobacterium croceum]|uniref:polysaccharide deacetylase family protein n=1 Tax=Flavobacterium croceum TaxID=370975 RepID=UPI0024A93CDC|nr:polysaccharide deacetylase family protein [Flavobacterium croceum]